MDKKYVVAKAHGMCGGVFAALRILDKMIADNNGEPVWVLHELVHNNSVTREFEARNVRFVDSPEAVPAGSSAVIGAHGVSAEVEQQLRKRSGKLADASCPLVKKLHNVAAGMDKEQQLIIFGKKGHPEVIGVAGHSNAGKTFIVADSADIAALPELSAPVFVSQTTVEAVKSDQAMAELQARFPHLKCVPGVCDASRQRQAAVRELASRCPVVIIAGSAHSSNACRLQEIAAQYGAQAFRVDNEDELPMQLLEKTALVGISSGASTPESVLKKIIGKLENNGFVPETEAL